MESEMTTDKECRTCDSTDCTSREAPMDKAAKERAERLQLQNRLADIRHKVLVLSGKGGVGKSTVAANLAVSLSLAGKRVGLLDIDCHGPSIPRLLNLDHARMDVDGGQIVPVEFGGNDGAAFRAPIKVVSLAFLLKGADDAVIWRGPMKMGVIRQFLKDVTWGELDYLVVDSPPGTGDEPLSICQLIENADGAVIVTTPQDLAVNDVRRCVNFCAQLSMPVLGVIENMSGLVCPKCGERVDLFKSGGGETMAADMGVPFLGRIPLDPQLVHACDAGEPYVQHYPHTETAKAFARTVAPILALSENAETAPQTQPDALTKEDGTMRIAIPVAAGKLAMHFGHCEAFVLLDVDPEKKEILGQTAVTPPAHEPGVLPRWLQEQGANLIIASGMGSRAQSLFAQQGIAVMVGAPSESPETIVQAYLDGSLEAGTNVCDH